MSREPVEVVRAIEVPDPVRVERCARMPELGPRILFFSGGTALRQVCRVLKTHTHNSIHLITPFDSGGSSATLRGAYAMPAVGDLRSRLMALADETVTSNPATYQLFSHRLDAERTPRQLRSELSAMTQGVHPLVASIREPLRRLVRTHLRTFVDQMPDDFDLRHASIGNLLLTGGYLANERDIDSVVFLFSQLIKARGLVRLTVADDITLFARTSTGETIAGQHRITERPKHDDSALVDLWLGSCPESPEPIECAIAPTIRKHILGADLLCYPIGSFYTSVLANLLPQGVGRAIADARCPKIYIPNTGVDDEQRGFSVAGAIDRLCAMVRRDAGEDVPIERIVNYVLVDSASDHYANPSPVEELHSRGVQVIDRPLASTKDPARINPVAVSEILLSLSC